MVDPAGEPVGVAVTHRSWVAEDLGFRLDHGFDPVHLQPGEMIWCAEFFAAKAHAAGSPYPVTTTLRWPEVFGSQFLRRDVRLLTVADTDALGSAELFVKLADAKDDRFVPAVCAPDDFASRLAEVSPDSLVIVSDAIPDLVDEWRTVILDGVAIDSSRYRHQDQYWDQDLEQPLHPEIEAFATAAAESALLTMPRSYALDIGTTAAGDMLVIEVNPIWCSAWYGAEIPNVHRALAAEFTDDPAARWVPDPILLGGLRRR